jgi:hypothetical protein
VSTSCGSLWFIDAGSVIIPAAHPIWSRFLSQDDRIAVADGLAAAVADHDGQGGALAQDAAREPRQQGVRLDRR